MSKFNITIGNQIDLQNPRRFHKALSMGTIREIMIGMLPCHYMQVHTNMIYDTVLYPVMDPNARNNPGPSITIRAEGTGSRLSPEGFLALYAAMPDDHVPVFTAWTAALGCYKNFQVHGLNVVELGWPPLQCIELKAHTLEYNSNE